MIQPNAVFMVVTETWIGIPASRLSSILMTERFAYYDRGADIAWFPTGPSASVVCKEVSWGLVDHDRDTGRVTGLEVWDAGTRVPASILEALPAPSAAHGTPD
jgi:hypothetical protein